MAMKRRPNGYADLQEVAILAYSVEDTRVYTSSRASCILLMYAVNDPESLRECRDVYWNKVCRKLQFALKSTVDLSIWSTDTRYLGRK